jgi:hypothetical protein
LVAFPFLAPGSLLCFSVLAGSPVPPAPGALSALLWPAACRLRLALRRPVALCCLPFRVSCLLLAGGLPVSASSSLFPAALAGGAAALPVLVASVGGCRWRWLVRGGSRCLAVRCSSLALAALVCRRARLFGLPPVRASARLVLLPVARVAPLALSARLAGLPARPGRVVSLAQGRLF